MLVRGRAVPRLHNFSTLQGAHFLASLRTLRTTASRAASTPESNAPPPTAVHFRNTPNAHPLGVAKTWQNPTINHVWTDQEVEQGLQSQPRHTPQLLTEKIISSAIHLTYWAFNKATGYEAANPTPESIITRLLFLESIAGVPGMVAAQHRHFASLRTMSRDYGWIHTLLEEAENERMHLLTFIEAFDATVAQRGTVYIMQFGWAAFFIPLYVLSPRTAHRSVGYIEEMAVYTYSNIIELMGTPGTKLHEAWVHKPVPPIAKGYWRMDESATFLDLIKQITMDETNHRDVNHTFAEMAWTDPNPHVTKHLEDAVTASAWWREKAGAAATEGKGLDYHKKAKLET